MSQKDYGKKFLVSTKDILHKSHFKFPISELCSLRISKFLIFSHDALVVGNEENDR